MADEKERYVYVEQTEGRLYKVSEGKESSTDEGWLILGVIAAFVALLLLIWCFMLWPATTLFITVFGPLFIWGFYQEIQ